MFGNIFWGEDKITKKKKKGKKKEKRMKMYFVFFAFTGVFHSQMERERRRRRVLKVFLSVFPEEEKLDGVNANEFYKLVQKI